MANSIDGFEVKEVEIEGKKVLHQKLNVGHAYSIPSVVESWRRSNNEDHALDSAKEDILSAGDAHAWKHSEANASGPEYVFSLKQQIADLKAQLVK